jgi:hypothetical protein
MRTLILITALAGCSTTDSSDVLTSGIYAGITASAPGNGSTQVSATLYLGNPINLNFVELTGDDKLVASHDGQDKVMVESELLNIVSHSVSFDSDNENDEFSVAFDRTVDDGAPDSSVTLPAKFDIAVPATTEWSRQAAYSVQWSPASTDQMRWEARGDCIETTSESLPDDTGGVIISANRIQKRMGDGVADTCPITLTLTRARQGDLDPGYGKGGSIEGWQVRTIDLTTTP